MMSGSVVVSTHTRNSARYAKASARPMRKSVGAARRIRIILFPRVSLRRGSASRFGGARIHASKPRARAHRSCRAVFRARPCEQLAHHVLERRILDGEIADRQL